MADYAETLSELANYPKALSHAGKGGGANLKSVILKNETGENMEVSGFIDANNKYVSTVDGYGFEVANGESVTAYYAEPITGGTWEMIYNSTSGNAHISEEVEGIEDYGGAFNIYAEAADGTTIIFITDEVSPDDPLS